MEPASYPPQKETTHQLSKEQIIAYLERDGLVNIPLLKIIHQFEKTVQFRSQTKETEYGILVDLPCATSGFYFNLYPAAKSILFPAATSNPDLLIPLFKKYLTDPLIIALPNEKILKVAQSLFRLEYQRSYISYVCHQMQQKVDSTEVKLSEQFSPEAITLFHQNGFHDADLAKFSAWGAKTFSLPAADGRIASICFIFPNNAKVWEIAGVRTQESERGKGLAKRIVQTAANYILEHGWLARYQVENSNVASIQLATSLGFEKFLELEHYVTQ